MLDTVIDLGTACISRGITVTMELLHPVTKNESGLTQLIRMGKLICAKQSKV